ncbi:UNVERIFIED_CONTAM: hypothetical protein Sradi_3177100 [Sesamum radiatum]|uniref:Polyprotein n=1 Tax=Sesamum radiatum TaxID=300843 RepID=A0AAW2RGR5_SESRA
MILDHLTTSMAKPIEPDNGPTAQYRCELDAYNKWLEQDMSARFTMLSCIHDNLIREYEKYPTAKDLWKVLKVAYGRTSATRLRALTLRFNQYVLDTKHSMIQHLDVMKDMIRELQNAGCELSDEQQVLAVLRSLPEPTWGHVKLVLTHNEQIKTFDSVASHLKLEADRRESERAQQTAFIAHAGQRKPHKGKHWNKPNGAEPSQIQKQNLAPQGGKTMKRRRGKRGRKKNMEKAKCYNCQKMGHFAREHTESKKIQDATKHVTRDRAGFVNYHRVPACSHYIAMGNGAQEEVLGIASYQLKLSTGRQERMTRLAREGLLGSLARVNLPTCESCMAGKACRKPFGKAKRATHPLELVHSDICGPMNVRARHGAFYFLTFIDDYSHYGSVYLLSHRPEALDCFKRFLTEVENQREKAQFRRLTPWGSAGFVHSTSHKYGKLGPRASKLIFIRYYEHSKGYVMYGEHPNKGMTKIESRDVDFLEEDFSSISEVKGSLELYELHDPQGGASITVEGETPNSYLVIDGDNESDLN